MFKRSVFVTITNTCFINYLFIEHNKNEDLTIKGVL